MSCCKSWTPQTNFSRVWATVCHDPADGSVVWAHEHRIHGDEMGYVEAGGTHLVVATYGATHGMVLNDFVYEHRVAVYPNLSYFWDRLDPADGSLLERELIDATYLSGGQWSLRDGVWYVLLSVSGDPFRTSRCAAAQLIAKAAPLAPTPTIEWKIQETNSVWFANGDRVTGIASSPFRIRAYDGGVKSLDLAVIPTPHAHSMPELDLLVWTTGGGPAIYFPSEEYNPDDPYWVRTVSYTHAPVGDGFVGVGSARVDYIRGGLNYGFMESNGICDIDAGGRVTRFYLKPDPDDWPATPLFGHTRVSGVSPLEVIDGELVGAHGWVEGIPTPPYYAAAGTRVVSISAGGGLSELAVIPRATTDPVVSGAVTIYRALPEIGVYQTNIGIISASGAGVAWILRCDVGGTFDRLQLSTDGTDLYATVVVDSVGILAKIDPADGSRLWSVYSVVGPPSPSGPRALDQVFVEAAGVIAAGGRAQQPHRTVTTAAGTAAPDYFTLLYP